MSQQLSYDIVPHQNGWAIVITPSHGDGFAAKRTAFDVAAEFARKLRFVGYEMHVYVPDQREPQRRAS
jgi:hypothetical protein